MRASALPSRGAGAHSRAPARARLAMVEALRAGFAAHADTARAVPMQAYMKSSLPVLTKMIISGAWWDFCDDISGNTLATLLVRHPREMKPLLRRWARGDDMWLRRAAMLCQRGLGPEAFDARLLYDTILPSIGHGRFADRFFIRKGIGWALRERSYAAPDEVAAFCQEYASQLSPLTRREAMKVITRRAGKRAA
jgi:3-methyladenine DNA glycosylase AlkD